jgi:hypothetical protein
MSKSSSKKTSSRKVSSKKTSTRKVSSKKTSTRKVSSKKTSTRKVSSKKTSSRKVSSKKTSSRKVSSKKTSSRKVSNKKKYNKKYNKIYNKKLKTLLKKTNNNTEKQYIKNLTFKELDELPNFQNSYISQCQKSANDRINTKNNKLSYQINQDNIKKYCACTYNSLVSKKKSINDLEDNIFDNIKGCVKKFNQTTKRFSKNKKEIIKKTVKRK